MRTPHPVCSVKLSMIWLGQYYGGGPRWNTQCCSFPICEYYYVLPQRSQGITVWVGWCPHEHGLVGLLVPLHQYISLVLWMKQAQTFAKDSVMMSTYF